MCFQTRSLPITSSIDLTPPPVEIPSLSSPPHFFKVQVQPAAPLSPTPQVLSTSSTIPPPSPPLTQTYKKKYTLCPSLHSPTLTAQLTQLETFWTQPNNLLRQEAAVNTVTHSKRKERILGFIGWCYNTATILQPTLELFDIGKSTNNRERYEAYLNYLKDERKLNIGTIAEHITAAVYVLKMLCVR